MDDLLKICWIIANAEAKQLGAVEIEPIHFMLGVLKIVDPKFPEQLEQMLVSQEAWSQMCKAAQKIRSYLEISPNDVTTTRRGLRNKLRKQSLKKLISEKGFLHRSSSLKMAFFETTKVLEGKELSLYELIKILFSLKLVTLEDLDKK